jgi:hypothetical protein
MKRWISLLLIVAVIAATVGPWAFAASGPGVTTSNERSPALPAAAAISTITGIAISPLLGTGAFGAYRWWTAKDDAAREQLPWYAQMKFWLPALLIVALCAAKDAAGTALPVELKKPFDVLELLENKLSGLIAAGAVIPITIDTAVNLAMGREPSAGIALFDASGLAMLQLGAIDGSWFLKALAVPVGVALFGVVWLASHAINVMILLSPWGAIDAALKAARTAVLGAVAVTAVMDPWMGAFFSLLVIVLSYFVAGWAFRLTVFGTLQCWDFLTLRSRRFSPKENDNRMFSGAHFTGVPARTYGRLVQRTEGALEFFYRPWPWLPVRKAALPSPREDLAIGRGLFFSEISNRNDCTILLLPQRYRGHEETLARAYLFGGGVKRAGLHKAWNEIRELFGGRAVKA